MSALRKPKLTPWELLREADKAWGQEMVEALKATKRPFANVQPQRKLDDPARELSSLDPTIW